MISLKACCGLLVSKNDDDHDYEDEEEPLPKPQSTAEQLKVGRRIAALVLNVKPEIETDFPSGDVRVRQLHFAGHERDASSCA